MTLEVLQAGMMLSVQDAGRTGLRHAGVSSAGPMDPPALAIANALVGNAPAAAGLEFAMLAGRFRATRPLRFAVTGGDPDVRLQGRPVAAWKAHRLAAGEVLTIGACALGVWGYLAVSGGVATEPVMGSRSTHLRTALGGLEGRALRAGDTLPLGEDDAAKPCLTMGPRRAAAEGGPIRLVLGPQADYFAEEAIERLTGDDFTVTPQSDRMAMALSGPELRSARGHDIISDGTVPGSIQVPGLRQPMVLMAECQTTGGYPKIATIIGADLPRMAQMRAGSTVRFRVVGRDEGEVIWIEHVRCLRAALSGLVPAGGGILTTEYLLSCDLVGGIWPKEEVVQ